MISDAEVEKALDFMRDNATKAAHARADRAYVEEYRKILKGHIMRENARDPLGAQEAIAYADARYVAHLKAIKEAVFEDERLRFMLDAARAKLDAWQTQSANNRRGLC